MRENITARKIALGDDEDDVSLAYWLMLPFEKKLDHMVELSHQLWEIHLGEKIEPRLQRHVVHLHKE